MDPCPATPVTRRSLSRFSFAHGGKDGTPFPVDRATYDKTIDVLHHALNRAKVDRTEKVKAFRRLGEFSSRRASAPDSPGERALP